MTPFWKNLHQLAQGQLFNGGYLGENSATRIAANVVAERNDRPRAAGEAPAQRLPTRLVACR